MLKRFLSFERPLKTMLTFPPDDLKDLKLYELQLSHSEWEKAKQLDTIFGIYQPIVEKLSGYSYPTLGDVLPAYIELKRELQKEEEHHTIQHPILAKAITAGIEKLDKYLDKSKLSEISIIATILNPYYKLAKLRSLGFNEAELRHAKELFLKAFDKYYQLYGIPETYSEEEYEEDDEDPGLVDDDMGGRVLNEAERYLKEHYVRRLLNKPNPLHKEWWQAREGAVYPVLARMARDYGVVMATSVPSESVFSIAGLIITRLRGRLNPSTMSIIMCLKSWGLLNDQLIAAAETEMGEEDEEGNDEELYAEKPYNLSAKGGVDVLIV